MERTALTLVCAFLIAFGCVLLGMSNPDSPGEWLAWGLFGGVWTGYWCWELAAVWSGWAAARWWTEEML